MYNYIIFDVDGTLIHTPLDYIANIINNTLKKFKDYKVSGLEAKQFWFKPGRDSFVKEHFKIENTEDFWHEFAKNDSVENRKKIVRLYESSDPFYLKFLKEKYCLKYSILSDAHPKITEMELELIGRDLFDCIVNTNPLYDGIKSKPNIDGALKILNELNILDKKGMFIGDSELDILCCKNLQKEWIDILDILMHRNEHKAEIESSEIIYRLTDLCEILENDY